MLDGLVMSNKFRNILYRTAITLLLLAAFGQLSGFTPSQKDFASRYQYDLYRSWLQKGNFSTRKSAAFAKDKVVKNFGSENEVTAIYLLKDSKIYDQQEPLSYLYAAQDQEILQPIVDYLQGFVYRLNAADNKFIFDLFSLAHSDFNFAGLSGKTALNKLLFHFQNRRINLSPIEIEITSELIIISSQVSKIDTISWTFPLNFDFVLARREIEHLEAERSYLLPLRTALLVRKDMLLFTKQNDSKTVISTVSSLHPAGQQKMIETARIDTISQKTERNFFKINEEPIKIILEDEVEHTLWPDIKTKPDVQFHVGMSIKEYLNRNLYADISRELLHNKITDPISFLAKEFSGYEISLQEDIVHLKGKTIKADFFSEIKLRINQADDGLYFLPFSDFEVEDKILNLSQSESIDLSNLSDIEAEIVASRLPQLIYEHRSLGTELLNFLLIHDNVPSTLVIQDDQRTIFEKESYADLLLLLNRYWNSCNVYFRIDNVKRKDGNVEMTAHLIASHISSGRNDIAEVRFLLDQSYSIDLIMMILHPDARI